MGNDNTLLHGLNANSLKMSRAYLKLSIADVPAGQGFRSEQHGYFVADFIDHTESTHVFNRVTGTKDSWGK